MTKALTPFDAYEVHGCRKIVVANERSQPRFAKAHEQCEDSEADFWCLYGHVTGEGLHDICDFRTRFQAEGFLELLKAAKQVHDEIERLLDSEDVMICSMAGDDLRLLAEGLSICLARIDTGRAV